MVYYLGDWWSPFSKLGARQDTCRFHAIARTNSRIRPNLSWRSPAPMDSEAAHTPDVRFELRNAGGRAVRLLSVSPSCACADQSLSTAVVEPNDTAYLSVQPRPIRFGTRRVSIEVRTDSPTTPAVHLSLLVLGAEPPPFLVSVDEGLTFHDAEVGAEGDLLVSTAELSNEEGPEVVFRTNLPFLQFRRVKSNVRPVGDSGTTYARTTTYRVGIASPPPNGSFLGEIRVFDPRRPDDVKSLQVRGESSPPIRVVPSRLIVGIEEAQHDPPKTFLVVMKGLGSGGSLRPVPVGENNPFLVEPHIGDPDVRAARFVLRLKPGTRPRPGVYDIHIATTSGPQGTILPILVREASP